MGFEGNGGIKVQGNKLFNKKCTCILPELYRQAHTLSIVDPSIKYICMLSCRVVSWRSKQCGRYFGISTTEANYCKRFLLQIAVHIIVHCMRTCIDIFFASYYHTVSKVPANLINNYYTIKVHFGYFKSNLINRVDTVVTTNLGSCDKQPGSLQLE